MQIGPNLSGTTVTGRGVDNLHTRSYNFTRMHDIKGSVSSYPSVRPLDVLMENGADCSVDFHGNATSQPQNNRNKTTLLQRPPAVKQRCEKKSITSQLLVKIQTHLILSCETEGKTGSWNRCSEAPQTPAGFHDNSV
ncbi:hypothetical protein CB1_000496008 [Camelus ferus]|nr:hypothetical protein CB1_000496008 [Camelus ferus]